MFVLLPHVAVTCLLCVLEDRWQWLLAASKQQLQLFSFAVSVGSRCLLAGMGLCGASTCWQ